MPDPILTGGSIFPDTAGVQRVISERVDRSKSADMRDFYLSHRFDALYQGTILVGPLKLNKIWAFFSRLVLRIVSDKGFG
jgi:hypothetical protein